MQHHINDFHAKSAYCSYCNFIAKNENALKLHVITEHEDSAIITIIGNPQLMLCEAMGVFKQDMGAAINAIVQGQNYIKSELLLMKEELSQTKHSCCKYEKNKGDMESQHDEEKTIDEAKQKMMKSK